MADRGLSDQQRALALDLTGLLLPRTSRFFAAVAVLTLGSDQKLAGVTGDLSDAVAAVLEDIADKDRKYTRSRSRAEVALGRFRDAADQRKR